MLILLRIMSEAVFILFFISPELIRGFYWSGPRVTLPVLQRPITVPLRKWSTRMAETRWISTSWFAARDWCHEMNLGWKWIMAQCGSQQDWDELLEVHDMRWVCGNGSQHTDNIQSPVLYEPPKFQSSADSQIYHVPAGWLHRVWFLALPRALPRALFRDAELIRDLTELQCPMKSWIRSYVTWLQCQYCISRSCMTYVVSRATISTERDDSPESQPPLAGIHTLLWV